VRSGTQALINQNTKNISLSFKQKRVRPIQVTDQMILDYIKAGLKEDVGSGDHSANACISSKSRSKAILKVKDTGMLAGCEMAKRILLHVDPSAQITFYKNDGSDCFVGDVAFEVVANTRALLKAERLLLNTMQRMSGIATLSSRFAFEVGDLPVKILDTRKTTPLIRFIEKWAVKIGGCENYRWGLYDWIMIKDNHHDAAGGIEKAIKRVHAYQKKKGLNLNITLEVRNLPEVFDALDTGGINRIMLDNFDPFMMREAVRVINKRYEVEASGGITLETVRAYALTGVDYVSAGALTHSAGQLDLSLKIVK
jgi:nicotinate-nucleotide pyrophosphorylase (carboxylating)